MFLAFIAPPGCQNTQQAPGKSGSSSPTSLPHSAYPVTATTNQVDTYHGVSVPDPYRWLEDDNAPATKAWVEAQNRVTFDYLSQIPERERIRARLSSLWNYERYGVPARHGSLYFYNKNDGLQNQSVLLAKSTLEGEPRVILDPNTLSADGTVALAGFEVSEDGAHLAYGVAAAGSDWQEWRVRNLAAGKDLPDKLQWIKFSEPAWTHDNLGFFYGRYPEPAPGAELSSANYNQKLYYHRLGTSQSEDTLVYERPDHKDWRFSAGITDDGRYLIISVHQGTDRKRRVYYRDLQAASQDVIRLLDDFDAAYTLVANDGPVFTFQTDLDAPKGRVIAIDIRHPERTAWKTLIPEQTDTLLAVTAVGGKLLANYLHDASSLVRTFSPEGTPIGTLALPGLGTVAGLAGKPTDQETFLSFTSFQTPVTIYRWDLKSNETKPLFQPQVQFNPGDYETIQVFYPSKDGTRIPMFISYKKGLKRTGKSPCYLYGYGGFNISLTPTFTVPNLQWMEMGGVYAMPNLRGGGEYGESWHKAGTKLQKQNVFDDFIAAAEWLIAQKYTSSKHLAIGGRSNGGLLVGACLTQRPDLYAATLPGVGVMDMLRFHKFTVGWGWTPDYGSPENPDEFKALHAYSPLHRIKPGTRYPATLVTTADHDDRVVPAHSFKFAATLQAAQAGRAPTLIRIDTRAGHGAGKPTSKQIEEWADLWAFLVHQLGMHPDGI